MLSSPPIFKDGLPPNPNANPHHHPIIAVMDSPAALGAAGEAGLRSAEKKALDEFRAKLEETITTNPDVSLWGVPLLPSKCHDGTDVILLKFLRAREFKPSEALEMLQKTLRWRDEFGVERFEETADPPDMKGAVYMSGVDRKGHPVCYNTYGAFRQRDLYQMAFGNEERRERFLRWRIQIMEEGIKGLSFKPGGVGSMVQVIDLKNSMNASTKEIRSMVKKVALSFQDNYPEFVEKHIFINVSFRYYAFHAMFSNLFTQRTKSKFVFARPCRVTETLLKFIAPEHIPIQYGGFQRENDTEFSAENGDISEQGLKPSFGTTIEIPIAEQGVTVVWDVAVVGWDVYYKEEFIPDDECSYTVLIQKEKKLEETVRNSFYISEPGKIVLTLDNRTFKKKKVLYRWKSKQTIPLYNLLSQPNISS